MIGYTELLHARGRIYQMTFRKFSFPEVNLWKEADIYAHIKYIYICTNIKTLVSVHRAALWNWFHVMRVFGEALNFLMSCIVMY